MTISIPGDNQELENKQDQQNEKWKTPFFTVWSSQALSLIGSAVGRFALVWWLTELTGSAVVLTTATLASVLPQVFLSPIAGAYIDRWNRRRIMIIADSLIALISMILAVLFWSGLMQVWHVYVVVLLRAIGTIFHGPAMSASTSLMVPEKHLSRIAGMNQTLNGTLMMVGPPLGALFLGFMPLHYVMLLDLATALPAIVTLFFINIPQPKREIIQESTSIWVEIQEGMRYIWNWKGIFLFLLMAAIGNFVYNPIVSLLPLYVIKHFSGEAAQLGWLQSAQGLGIVLGGFILSIWGGFKKRIYTTILGQILQGISTVIFGLISPSAFWAALLMWGLAFFFNVFYNGPLFALLQAVVRPEMQGRVFTTLQSMVWIAWPLSLVIAGPVADQIGIQVWIIVGGGVAAILGVSALFTPAIVNMEKHSSAKSEFNEI